MSVSLKFPTPRSIDLVGFAWSPLFEAVLSMPVVLQPKRTPMHLPWARRARELPTDLLDEIRVLLAGGFVSGFVPGIFEIGLRGDSPVFGDELRAFDAIDEELVAYELSLMFGGIHCGVRDGHGPHLVHDDRYRHDVLANAAENPDHLALMKQIFDDPAAVRQRYSVLLTRYWEAAFATEWDRLLPRIEHEVTDGAHALVTSGLSGLVREILPEGRWDEATCTIVIDKDWDGECDVADRGQLLFVPTVYGWPRVLLELTEPWPLSVIFPLRDLRQPAVPQATDHEVADGFRALADETRLQVARLVAENPRSTKELAELLSLSDSAISRHLKILDAAGLVTGRRDGYFVLYRLEPDRIDVLGRALRHTLGLAQSSGGDVPALQVSLGRNAGR